MVFGNISGDMLADNFNNISCNDLCNMLCDGFDNGFATDSGDDLL